MIEDATESSAVQAALAMYKLENLDTTVATKILRDTEDRQIGTVAQQFTCGSIR